MNRKSNQIVSRPLFGIFKMKKLYFILLLVLLPLSSMGQVDIKFGFNGMKENSIIMLNAMCSCYGKDSVFYMLDSLSYHGLFVCEIDSNGFVVDIPWYKSKKSSFRKRDLVRIKKYLNDHHISFSVIYENDLGENEESFKIRIRKDLKRYFRQHKTIPITVGFPGLLTAPWERFLGNQRRL